MRQMAISPVVKIGLNSRFQPLTCVVRKTDKTSYDSGTVLVRQKEFFMLWRTEIKFRQLAFQSLPCLIRKWSLHDCLKPEFVICKSANKKRTMTANKATLASKVIKPIAAKRRPSIITYGLTFWETRLITLRNDNGAKKEAVLVVSSSEFVLMRQKEFFSWHEEENGASICVWKWSSQECLKPEFVNCKPANKKRIANKPACYSKW